MLRAGTCGGRRRDLVCNSEPGGAACPRMPPSPQRLMGIHEGVSNSDALVSLKPAEAVCKGRLAALCAGSASSRSLPGGPQGEDGRAPASSSNPKESRVPRLLPQPVHSRSANSPRFVFFIHFHTHSLLCAISERLPLRVGSLCTMNL